ncbi:MAG: HAMP domain-containing sensor histidine kinase [Bdellovibrionota bacterium]
MHALKAYFVRAISVGVHQQLSEEKKLAIQLSTLDGYWTFLAIFSYFLITIFDGRYPLYLFHGAALVLVAAGVYCYYLRRYDLGRFMVNIVGMTEVFLTADAAKPNVGYEYYYLVSIAVPFIIFTHEEKWKGACLTLFSTGLFIFQQVWGTGIFLDVVETPPEERIMSILFVVSYFFLLFTVGRWQVRAAQREIAVQQQELIHSSSLVALGEMAAGIAHEINNPLQVLSLQLAILKDSKDIAETRPPMEKMEKTVERMGKLITGLKHLSRKDAFDPIENFTTQELIDSVMSISSDRFDRKGVTVNFKGQSDQMLSGHLIQMSQVLINLLNNSIHAVKDLTEKWVEIEVRETVNSMQLMVTDSGSGIEHHIAENIMKPFFTTKGPQLGTGLGLSISQSIVQKHGGILYYDRSCPNTRFIIEMPTAYLKLERTT